MSAEFTCVVADRPDRSIRRIAIDVPQRRNAIDPTVVGELVRALAEALDDSAVRAVVLTGAGGTFCSGGDLKSTGRLDEAGAAARMKRNHELAGLVFAFPKPVVAAIEGWAMGGGAGLALLADIVVAGRSAKIGFPFLRVGLVPDYGLMHTLARRVGVGRARQLILGCRTVTGEEALAMGLVDHSADDAAVQRVAVELACEAARLPAQAFRRVKQALTAFPRSFAEDIRHEFDSQVACFTGAEHAEGRAAFLEKREPDFFKPGT